MDDNSEQCYEVNIKTAVYYNKIKIHNFDVSRTGLIKSGTFFGTSPHSSLPVSWYYVIDPARDITDTFMQIRDTYTTVQVVTATCPAVKTELHGKVEIFGRDVSSGRLQRGKTQGNIKAGSTIGKGMQVTNSSFQVDFAREKTLEIRFMFSLQEEILENVPLYTNPRRLPDIQLLDHLAGLLENDKFSDVTVIVRSKEFPVHKAILSARSPVFAAMFGQAMLESQQNRVTIDDIDPKVFQEVLRFIYTGTVKELEQMPGELLAAADKYALDKLRSDCEEHLGATLSVESATKTLHLADLHNAGQLKQRAIQFIAVHMKEIQKEDWKNIITANPDIAAEMFAEMVRLH